MAQLSLAERFAALDRFLIEGQHLWRPRPFVERQLPWETEYPALAQWLRGRRLEQAGQEAADEPALLRAWRQQAQALCQVDELPCLAVRDLPHELARDVPGRKWLQIDAFARHLRFAHPTRHWLDWCSGKGHLGHRLQFDGGALTCLEHDPQLCAAGAQLARRLGLDNRHHCQDVLDEGAARFLDADTTPVALHACGDLHVRLLQLAARRGSRQLALVPCCYNRTASESYQPLSRQGQASALHLHRDDLALPLEETVTAGRRVQRQRDQSMAWRLGLDALQREYRGVDEYCSMPSVPGRWLNKPFDGYCRDLAGLRGLLLPLDCDWPRFETLGWQRLAEVRNLEQVRGLFRRPLEVWLLLDRALFLEQQGYRVRLGTFCDYRLTPRNLMLLAELAGASGNGEQLPGQLREALA